MKLFIQYKILKLNKYINILFYNKNYWLSYYLNKIYIRIYIDNYFILSGQAFRSHKIIKLCHKSNCYLFTLKIVFRYQFTTNNKINRNR